MSTTVTRRQVRAFRWRAQQLDRERGTLADTALLDLGVQDTGPDGARWALAVRGVDVASLAADELVMLWTVRGAPHVYRRADVGRVAAAVQPWSDADAARRIADASRPLRAAGIDSLAALDAVASLLREIVTEPTVKGEVSAALTARVDPPYLLDCRPCGARHVHELPFRLATVRAGLELEPGTSPPVLRPIPGRSERPGGPDERFDLVRGCLRLLGPTTPRLVAGYVEAPVEDVRARWPDDVGDVVVDGRTRQVLAEDVARLDDRARGLRLLGPYDLFLQARDREVLVDDPARARQLWPVLGRPGVVAADGDVVGSWRPRRAGASLRVEATVWGGASPAVRAAIGVQAERLADFRGLRLARVDLDG